MPEGVLVNEVISPKVFTPLEVTLIVVVILRGRKSTKEDWKQRRRTRPGSAGRSTDGAEKRQGLLVLLTPSLELSLGLGNSIASLGYFQVRGHERTPNLVLPTLGSEFGRHLALVVPIGTAFVVDQK